MPTRPTPSEYAPFYADYVASITESDVIAVLENQTAEIAKIVGAVTPDRETYRYAEGKWSIREVIGHLLDGERVFGYRAFCISRGDVTPLPGFDENVYVAESGYHDRALSDLLAEFTLVRKANLALFNRLNDTEWKRLGTANDNPVSVRALAYMLAGHVRHHCNVLRTAYGVSPKI